MSTKSHPRSRRAGAYGHRDNRGYCGRGRPAGRSGGQYSTVDQVNHARPKSRVRDERVVTLHTRLRISVSCVQPVVFPLTIPRFTRMLYTLSMSAIFPARAKWGARARTWRTLTLIPRMHAGGLLTYRTRSCSRPRCWLAAAGLGARGSPRAAPPSGLCCGLLRNTSARRLVYFYP